MATTKTKKQTNRFIGWDAEDIVDTMAHLVQQSHLDRDERGDVEELEHALAEAVDCGAHIDELVGAVTHINRRIAALQKLNELVLNYLNDEQYPN